MKHFLTRCSALLGAAALLLPMQAGAENTRKQVKLDPPKAFADYEPIGMLHLCMDSKLNGSTLEVVLTTPEGDMQHYLYPAYVFGSTEVCCPFMRDGSYKLNVRIPQADAEEYAAYSYDLAVPDVDPVDKAPEFTYVEHYVYLDMKPSMDSDVSTATDPVLKDGKLVSEMHCTYARPGCTLGDVNRDNTVNAKDATAVLVAAASLGVGEKSGLSSLAFANADVNGDQKVNAKDGTLVLSYAAAAGAGTFSGTMTEYLMQDGGQNAALVPDAQ